MKAEKIETQPNDACKRTDEYEVFVRRSCNCFPTLAADFCRAKVFIGAAGIIVMRFSHLLGGRNAKILAAYSLILIFSLSYFFFGLFPDGEAARQTKFLFVSYSFPGIIASFLIILSYLYWAYAKEKHLGGGRAALKEFMTKSLSGDRRKTRLLKERLEKIRERTEFDKFEDIKQYLNEGYVCLAGSEIEKIEKKTEKENDNIEVLDDLETEKRYY